MCFAVSVSSSPWVTPLQCCSVSPATSFYILLQPLPSLPFEFQPVQGLVWGSDLFSSPKRRRRREEIVILFFLAWNERSILHLGNAVPFSCCEAEGLCSLWSSCHLCMSVCLAQCSLCWSLNLSFVSRKKKNPFWVSTSLTIIFATYSPDSFVTVKYEIRGTGVSTYVVRN